MTKQQRIQWLKTCTAKERRGYYGEVANLGCVVCGMQACTHHCYGSQFPAKREHRPCIPLCYKHHQGDGGIHSGKQSFEDYYGTQDEMLEKVEGKLEQN